jgi:hypothetical protein
MGLGHHSAPLRFAAYYNGKLREKAKQLSILVSSIKWVTRVSLFDKMFVSGLARISRAETCFFY